jgi:CubicO group peptidase (beta-lactamase class C family)
MAPDTRHLSQSVAKSVLGVLVSELGLDVDTPVTELVPEVADSGYAGATLGHLLDMTAATEFVEDYAHFERYDAACGWHEPIPGVPGTILEFLAQIGPGERPHGEVFDYASPNTDLLGIAAERATDTPLAELISTRLWSAVGAEHDALLAVDAAGTAVISGGFNATLRDYLRFGLHVLETWPAGLGANGYAGQWWRLRDGVIAAQGIHGQFIGLDRAAQRVVTVLSSWPVATDDALRNQQYELIGGGETI